LKEFIAGEAKPSSLVHPFQRSQIVVAPWSIMYRQHGPDRCSSSGAHATGWAQVTVKLKS
jgi:hypothetical protein